jgi:dihydroorotate dehydrogenase
MRVFAETGVAAVVATNTLGQPVTENSATLAGVGGGRLHQQAVAVTTKLLHEKEHRGYTMVDIVGCGGIIDSATFRAFGTPAAQYWSALVYRGPLAAALILNEVRNARQTNR